MATCDMGYDHDEPVAEPEPVVVPVDPGPNENDVKIAEIEAAASIKREEIWTEQQALSLEANTEELRGEIRGMREVLDRLVPPAPEPEPIVLPVPEPEPAPAEESVAPPIETAPKKETPRKRGFFG
jgi:hypothetical protein